MRRNFPAEKGSMSIHQKMSQKLLLFDDNKHKISACDENTMATVEFCCGVVLIFHNGLHNRTIRQPKMALRNENTN